MLALMWTSRAGCGSRAWRRQRRSCDLRAIEEWRVALDPAARDLDALRPQLDADGRAPASQRGGGSCTAAREQIEHDAARWARVADDRLEELRRLVRLVHRAPVHGA